MRHSLASNLSEKCVEHPRVEPGDRLFREAEFFFRERLSQKCKDTFGGTLVSFSHVSCPKSAKNTFRETCGVIVVIAQGFLAEVPGAKVQGTFAELRRSPDNADGKKEERGKIARGIWPKSWAEKCRHFSWTVAYAR